MKTHEWANFFLHPTVVMVQCVYSVKCIPTMKGTVLKPTGVLLSIAKKRDFQGSLRRLSGKSAMYTEEGGFSGWGTTEKRRDLQTIIVVDSEGVGHFKRL